jgi:ABC-type glycerol-3-phosphate transport system permease component
MAKTLELVERANVAAAGAGLGLAARRRMLKAIVMPLLVIYALLTLFPFYVLFVRTFIGTKDATDLHLWIPPQEDISMAAEIGNISIFFNLDIAAFKEAMGIKGYVTPHTTLGQIVAKYDVPEQKIKQYFAKYGRFNGWVILLGEGKLWAAMGRSALITVVSMVGINFLSICTGYGLAGLRRKDQMFVYNLFLVQSVIPAMLVIVPQFMVVQWFTGLFPKTDSWRHFAQLLSLILLNIRGGAMSTMLFTSAIGAIPRDIEESAMIDGASRLHYFRDILLPLMKVPIASMTVISLPWYWNEFLEAFVYLDPNNTTLLPLIQNYSGQYTTNYQVVYTAIFVSILPLVVLYIVFRRWFISGALAGAVKG